MIRKDDKKNKEVSGKLKKWANKNINNTDIYLRSKRWF